MEVFLNPEFFLIAVALISAFIILRRRPLKRTFETQDVTKRCPRSFKEKECRPYKELYVKLHILELNFEILPRARSLLLSLLSETLQSETNAENTILSLDHFSTSSLDFFIHAQLETVTREWQQYLARRKQGLSRELFQDAANASRWLVKKAPLKLVDGAWLGHVHKITSPFTHRRVTRAAWHILSEELGDGDLTKCHAYLYARLLEQVGAPTPEPDSDAFIQHDGMDDIIVWRSAVAQLLISVFSHDFLPEMLGFNLNYEMPTLETLVAAKELREVGIDPYYFTLHITIDNTDTGHTAMASRIVADYLRLVAVQQGDAAVRQAWKRVQAGFVLSKNIHQTPNACMNARIIDIFLAKSRASHGVHEHCPLRLGGRTLSTWLNPEVFRDRDWQMDFLRCLGNAKPWIYKGNSSHSRLVHEFSWGGSMFGAFTDREVAFLRDWIDSLAPPGPQSYEAFIGRTNINESALSGGGLRGQNLVFTPTASDFISAGSTTEALSVDMLRVDFNKLLPLWFTHSCLLEDIVSIPWNVANPTGCAIVRILRAQYGFLPEPVGVHGVDELCRDDHIDLVDIGMDMLSRAEPGRHPPESIEDVLKMWSSPFAEMILVAAARPRELTWTLLGMTQAFTKLHRIIASSDVLLSTPKREALSLIVDREEGNMSICRERLTRGGAEELDFHRGWIVGLQEIRACFD